MCAGSTAGEEAAGEEPFAKGLKQLSTAAAQDQGCAESEAASDIQE